MEDVWKGITSLSDNTSTNTPKSAKFQDFLARPYTPQPPITVLSLSNRSEFHVDPLTHKESQSAQPRRSSASKVETFRNPFQNRAHSFISLPTSGKKMTLRPATTSGDIRNARLMKNREAAARSRARKQAYVFELKQKVKCLQEENARLRRQQQLVRETAANQGKKGILYRTYTAPF